MFVPDGMTWSKTVKMLRDNRIICRLQFVGIFLKAVSDDVEVQPLIEKRGMASAAREFYAEIEYCDRLGKMFSEEKKWQAKGRAYVLMLEMMEMMEMKSSALAIILKRKRREKATQTVGQSYAHCIR